jgi:hypothetical protein
MTILRTTGERSMAVKCPECHAIVQKGCALPDCPLYCGDDPINPSHYLAGDTYETIRVIEAWELNYNLGNCLKYISRCGRKGSRILDLEKARWYLDREISNLKAAAANLDSNGSFSKESGI